MQLSWGYKIAGAYIGFVALIATMVFLTMRQRIDLVATNYYEQELKYQERIDDQNRTNAMQNALNWQVKSDYINLQFSTDFKIDKISGQVYFFRPSNQQMDKTVSFSTDSTLSKNISTGQLKPGLYKMQVSWQAKGLSYFKEGIIQIN